MALSLVLRVENKSDCQQIKTTSENYVHHISHTSNSISMNEEGVTINYSEL